MLEINGMRLADRVGERRLNSFEIRVELWGQETSFEIEFVTIAGRTMYLIDLDEITAAVARDRRHEEKI